MKYPLMPCKPILLLMVLLFALGLPACQKPKDKNADQVLDINLLKSPGKYADILNDRTGGQLFSIEDIQTEGTTLKIKVKGGCPDDAFIIWNGAIMESYPAQVSLLLTYEPNPESCSDSNEYEVTVDLTKIIGTQNPKNFVFRIANGSIKQDKSLNPDGSVASSVSP